MLYHFYMTILHYPVGQVEFTKPIGVNLRKRLAFLEHGSIPIIIKTVPYLVP